MISYIMTWFSDAYTLFDVIVICFFKQKTAYEIQYGLVGSEMCIRDSIIAFTNWNWLDPLVSVLIGAFILWNAWGILRQSCLLYTSDAADERSSVDLGGRRIIKKKKERILSGLRDRTAT